MNSNFEMKTEAAEILEGVTNEENLLSTTVLVYILAAIGATSAAYSVYNKVTAKSTYITFQDLEEEH